MNLLRRQATPEDIPFLLRLRHESMDKHLQASGASTDDADHLARLQYRFDCAQVLLYGGESIGLLKLARDGQNWEIIQIQLLPEFQGRGIGAHLLQEVIGDAVEAHASLTLNVLKANPARALYQRQGFVVESENEDEYRMRLQA